MNMSKQPKVTKNACIAHAKGLSDSIFDENDPITKNCYMQGTLMCEKSQKKEFLGWRNVRIGIFEQGG